jgi:putative flippase GtrA
MWEMFTNSMQMFLKGKLFRDNAKVFTQGAVGVLVAIALIILLGKFAHLPMWAAALVGGLVSGALMPYLFKDLKYA